MPDLEHYRGGREQGYIKHALIEKYLVPFTIKIGSKWDEIVFLDAFAGPWGAQTENLSDTSFGIALDRMKDGLEALRQSHGRSPRIRAYLVEKDLDAYGKLDAFVRANQSRGIEVECFRGEFEDQIPKLTSLVTSENSFVFSLIDPKGWTGLSMSVIAPFLRRRPSEVLVNVMTSFLYRFVNHDDCQDSYEEFFGRRGVGEIIARAAPDDRQDAVVREYCRSLRELCGFEYVSSCVVLEPDKKGIKYFMVFATNSPTGIKVFKEAEAHAASLQDELKHAKEFGDQFPLFPTDAIEPVSESLRRKYREIAFWRVEEMFAGPAEFAYSEVFCKAMAMPLVTEDELLEFIKVHPLLELILDGPRRRKPSVENKNDRVRRSPS
jgi:three-Cys-motif partner protein